MFGFRVLRKRWVLFLILFSSVIYFLVATLSKSNDLILEPFESKRNIRQTFQWQPKISDELEVNNTLTVKCRNSVQGRKLIVDERGYSCQRRHLDSNNCCDTKQPSTSRYNCQTCHTNGCCSVYEYCVSCCLQPDKQPLLEKILRDYNNEPFNKLFSLVLDHFELCLAKCRTSSQSVQHENSYRDPKSKYCYGESAPDLQSAIL
ncbi:SREBP regulating gene protein-like [Patella vulgata]|uniref:SREBP regulating gene protein n=1 Tax=Patella caerulea TaxID=87958 RepID=A0AAN8K6H0_PATCE|nr:SREBP regulating gene protein-like [Patella vulgata]